MNHSLKLPTSGTVTAELADLVERLSARIQAGEAVDFDEFASDHPEYADELRRLLPAMKVMAELSGSPEAGAETVRSNGLNLAEPLGDFRLLREVGRGGMGIVYEAVQLSLNRRVALKVLPFAATMDSKQLQRFKNEALAAASLRHDHIVHVYGVGCERGVHYYAMEFIDGHTLAQLIPTLHAPPTPSPLQEEGRSGGTDIIGPYDPAGAAPTAPVAALTTELSGPKTRAFYRTVARLAAEAADALEHAHNLGIVHRDIKPGNLMVDGAGKIWVTDFGLARFGPDAGLTISGDLLGTLRYMAPEQALARHGLVDHRADVYALAATLYELLTGRPVVDATERAEILRQLAFEEPTPLRKLDRAIPTELETITLKALAKNPNERYATAGELGDDLLRWMGDKAIKAKPPGLRQRAVKWVRRHRTVVAAGVILFLIAVAGLAAGTLLVLREKNRTEERFQVARTAVDDMYTQVAENWLENEPEMSDVQRRFLLKALAFYEQFADVKSSERSIRLDRGIAYARVGRIHQKLGESGLAKEAYSQAISSLQLLADEYHDQPEYRRHLADTHRRLGVLMDRQHQYGVAEIHLRQAIAICEMLVAEFPEVEDYRSEQVGALGELGTTLSRAGRLDLAEPILRQVISHYELLIAKNPNEHKYQSNLGGILHNLLGAMEFNRQAEEGRLLIERAIQHQERAIQLAPRQVAYRVSLANHYFALGTILSNQRQTADVEAAYRKGITIREKLIADFPGVPHYRSTQAINWYNLGNLLKKSRGDKEAEIAYRQAIELLNDLTSKPPDVFVDQMVLGATLHNLAGILRRRDEWTETVHLYEQAIVHQQKALKLKPNDPASRQYLRNHYSSLSGCLTKSADLSLRNSERAVELAQKAIELDPKFGFGYSVLGFALYRSGSGKAALAALTKGLELSGDNQDESQGEAHFFLAMAHWQLGDKEQARASNDRAIQWMEKHDPQDREVLRCRAEAAELLGIKDTSKSEKQPAPKPDGR